MCTLSIKRSAARSLLHYGCSRSCLGNGCLRCKPFHLRPIPLYLDNSAPLCIMRYPQNFRQAQRFAVRRLSPPEDGPRPDRTQRTGSIFMTDNEFFGTARISRILMKLTPPVMLAQLIQALYNIVDSFFVGRYAEAGPDSPVHHLSPPAADDRAGRGHRRGDQHRHGLLSGHPRPKTGRRDCRSQHASGPGHVGAVCRRDLSDDACLRPDVHASRRRSSGRW